ncbi:MAG: hypothetical protein PHQ96_08410 [Candidatus Omnitrophica bacterium]|nr:hypothetical protein [Candidatus Omnitrophota bacterium]
MENKISIKIDVAIFCVLAVALIIVFFSLPRLGLYVDDSGRKYIQMKAFYLNGYKDYDIHYPGKAMGFGVAALNPQYFTQKNGKIFVNYYLPFTFLSSLFYPLFGDRAINFLPLLAFFLSAIIFSGILHLIGAARRVYYLLLFGFICASPLYVYSITFWEHVPLIFLTTASLYFLTKFFILRANSSNLSLASVFLALGVFLRPESVILLGAFYISIFLYLHSNNQIKKIIPVTACLALVLLCYCLFNHYFYGYVLLPGKLPWIFPFKKYFIYAGVAGAITLLASSIYKSLKDERAREFIILLVLAVFFFYLGASRQTSFIRIFFCLFPSLAIILFDLRANVKNVASLKLDAKAALFLYAALFLLGILPCLGHNPNVNVRFLLPLVPIIFVFLCLNKSFMEKTKGAILLVSLLLIVGFIFNLNFLKNEILKYEFYNAARISFIKENTKTNDVIIFLNLSPLSAAGPLFSERTYVLCDRKWEIGKVLGKLKKAGVTRFYLWGMAQISKDYFLKERKGYQVVDTRVFSSKYVKLKQYLFEIKEVK